MNNEAIEKIKEAGNRIDEARRVKIRPVAVDLLLSKALKFISEALAALEQKPSGEFAKENCDKKINWLKKLMQKIIDSQAEQIKKVELWNSRAGHLIDSRNEQIKQLQAENEKYKGALESMHFYGCGACEDNQKVVHEALKDEDDITKQQPNQDELYDNKYFSQKGDQK